MCYTFIKVEHTALNTCMSLLIKKIIHLFIELVNQKTYKIYINLITIFVKLNRDETFRGECF